MPEFSPATRFMLRGQLRSQLLRALDALGDDRLDDADAFAVTRNTVASILTMIDTVEHSLAFLPARAA